MKDNPKEKTWCRCASALNLGLPTRSCLKETKAFLRAKPNTIQKNIVTLLDLERKEDSIPKPLAKESFVTKSLRVDRKHLPDYREGDNQGRSVSPTCAPAAPPWSKRSSSSPQDKDRSSRISFVESSTCAIPAQQNIKHKHLKVCDIFLQVIMWIVNLRIVNHRMDILICLSVNFWGRSNLHF